MKVLLLHGALGCSTQLEPVRLALEEKGLAVYDLNFSGHGGEPFTDKFGIETFAEEIRNFIVSNKLNGLTIFGYSMSGYAALWMAHQYPSLVQEVVTLGTKFDWSPDSAEKEIKKMNPEKIEQKIPAFARLLQTRHAPNDWKELMSKTADMMKQLGDAPLLTESILAQINIPITIALGDADDMADRAYSERVAQRLPNAKFVLLSETPHPIEKVSVERIVELIG
jgi:pimeloyl-ACP methyl ester carboxylesterase